MGTHSNNPSYDYETKRSLEDFIKDNQALMGNDVSKKYGEKLPFLFKVLSAQKALSIQAHPNKKLAKPVLSEAEFGMSWHVGRKQWTS